MTNNLKYLGQTINFPLIISNGTCRVGDSKDSIVESIRRILSTPKGTLFYLPEYGSRINELMFEHNDEVLKSMLRLFIFESISIWEKRVKFVDVKFEIENDKINCELLYEIVSTSEIASFTYPFYNNIKY